MTPFRRLALLAQDVQGPLKVERSVKMADQVDPRFLIMFPTSATNKALTIQFSERSGMDASGWSKSAEKSDHLGVCACLVLAACAYTHRIFEIRLDCTRDLSRIPDGRFAMTSIARFRLTKRKKSLICQPRHKA